MRDVKIAISELITAAAIMLTGIFFALVGAGIFPFSLRDCWAITLSVCFLVISLGIALPQKNAIGYGASCTFAIITLACVLAACGLSKVVYPLYIIAVALGVGIAIRHHKIATVAFAIAGAGAILFLESSSLVSIWVALGIIAAYFGLMGILYASIKLKKLLCSKENK